MKAVAYIARKNMHVIVANVIEYAAVLHDTVSIRVKNCFDSSGNTRGQPHNGAGSRLRQFINIQILLDRHNLNVPDIDRIAV